MKRLLNRLFVETSDNVLLQLFRYTFVGGFAFVVDFGLLYALTELVGMFYLASATCAFLAGLSVNYALSVAWVFHKSRLKSKWMEFLLFALVGVVGLGLTTLFLWIFTDLIGIHYLISKIITTILVYLWNFLGRKYWLFN